MWRPPGCASFNDAYCYVEWLLTWLLIESILAMKLHAKMSSLSWSSDAASALMVALGYTGEMQDELTVRWFCWLLAMLQFCYVVSQLVIGLSDATS